MSEPDAFLVTRCANAAQIPMRDARVVLKESGHAELVAALEVFAECIGEGVEDYPDEMGATIIIGRSSNYLQLGDFRRALAALKRAGAL